MKTFPGGTGDPGKGGILEQKKLLEMEVAQVCAFVSENVGKLPLYISVDKDVLCKDDADTNWSQGYAPGYDAEMSEESQRNMFRGNPWVWISVENVMWQNLETVN